MIYKYITEGKIREDFRNYQNSIKLFENLKDGNVNPIEVLKNEINFKSDLGKTKRGNPDLYIEAQISAMQNVDSFFIQEKKVSFF